MMLSVTSGELDITAPDLARELAKQYLSIAVIRGSAISRWREAVKFEPGEPDKSLLYHAFATPTVVSDPTGHMLGGFPTVAEIDIVENYIYTARAATLDALHAANNGLLAIVTFALHYRNAPDSVSGKHAQLCFSRTGVVRSGHIDRSMMVPGVPLPASIPLVHTAFALYRPGSPVSRAPDAGWNGGIRPSGFTRRR